MEGNVARNIYAQISRIAAVDTAIRQGLAAGRFMFNYWPMTGQEAIPAVFTSLLSEKDYMLTTYRGVHDQVAKGVPLDIFFAEAMGKATGANKGKGGLPHLSHLDSGNALATAIVGAGAPIANGFALASQQLKDGRITVVNFGDGATSIGAVHEAMNMAAAWKLPVIFLLQNNLIGEYTPIPGYTATKQFVDRAEGYGMKGIRADGNDIEALYEAASEAVDYVRSGAGPVFFEAMTFRLGPHYGITPGDHFPPDVMEKAQREAPVLRAREFLISKGICTEEDIVSIDAASKEEVAKAIEWALAQPAGDVAEALTDVYADPEPAAPADPRSKEEKEMTFFQAIADAMDVALERDPRVILMGEDVGDPPGGVQRTSVGLQTKYGPHRVLPTPIAETAIIGAGMGSAMVGLRPICEIMFSDFLTCCMDPLVNHIAKQRYMSGGKTGVPMTVRVMTEPGPMGGNGAQHSQSVEAWLAHIPGLKVIFPSNPRDAKGLLASCIVDPDPCLIFESRRLMSTKGMVPLGDFRIPLGVADVKREGKDLSIICYGMQVNEALRAAEDLAREGIEVEVVDLRSIVPLDRETLLKSVSKTGRALVVHNATEAFGVSAEVCQIINEELYGQLKAPAQRMGSPFSPIPFSRALETVFYPNAAKIVARIKSILS